MIFVNILYIATDVYFPAMNGGSRRAYETARIFLNHHQASIIVNKKREEKNFELYEGIQVYRTKLFDIGLQIRKTFLLKKKVRVTAKSPQIPLTSSSNTYETYFNQKKPSNLTSKLKDFYRHKFPLHKILKTFPTFFTALKVVKREKIDIIIERGPSYGVGALVAFLLNRIYIVDFIDIMYSNHALKHADLVLSYFTTNQIPHFVPRAKIQRVFTCVDSDRFKPLPKNADLLKQFNFHPSDFVCIYVGGMYPWHGLDIIVRAAADLKQNHIDDVKFLLLGDGIKRQELLTFVNTHNLSSIVKLPGKVDFSEVPLYLNCADAALSLNTGDSVGFKLIEYMACNIPILATNADILDLVAIDKVESLHVNLNDPVDLTEKILFLKNHPQFALDLGNNARKRVLRDFQWTSHYQNILQGIRTIIKQKSTLSHSNH